jgi:hypothetical protein
VVAAPQGRPRIAAIAPPPASPEPSRFDETIFVSNDVIVLPDGRVLIDLGDSYEQVARVCPYAFGYRCRYRYTIPPQTLLFPSYEPPTYVVPVYVAEPYPVFAYPSGGYVSYAPPPYYVEYPPGYVVTGGYPPYYDPYYYAPPRSTTVPVSGPLHAAPPRAAPTTLRPVRR